MGTELPDRGATHAETANEETVIVDGIRLTGVLIRFPEVDFTGELVGATIAAIGMQDETVSRGNLADALAAVLEETQLTQGLATAMAPEVEAQRRADIGLRHDHAVRLNRTVNARAVGTDDGAFLRGPRSFPFSEGGGAGLTFGDEFMGGLKFGILEKLIIADRPIDGLVEDLDVGQELGQTRVLRLGLSRVIDGHAQFNDALLDGLLVGLRHGDAGRRDRANGLGHVILGPISEDDGGE